MCLSVEWAYIFRLLNRPFQAKQEMYSFTLSLTSALDWVVGQRHAPAPLPPGERPGTQRTRGCVGA